MSSATSSARARWLVAAPLAGRNHVLPDDVQAVITPVAGHRLRPAKGAATSHRARAELVAELIKAVAVP